MNADALRAALAASCDVDAPSGVFVSRRAPPIAYADGAEEYLAGVIGGASDVGTGSPELARAIHDWPSQYHLSGARANLLRPLALSRDLCVLEVGAGCGAITRFLGESCGAVLALEGSLARARIAAARCRGLDNVVVACGAFPGIGIEDEFDLVTLIGVLEYARVYLAGDDPVQAMLAAARARVRPGGRLVVAIENQLGLKYLAGAPEDHLGVPYAGVLGAYGPQAPVTFGRAELRERLQRAGFDAVELLYPFPDYKLPAAILADAAFSQRAFNASDLVATSYAHRFGEPEERAYPESLARDAFVRNGMGADTANSFLAIAGKRAAPRDALAYAYTVGRDRPYAGETRFLLGGDGVVVERRALFEAAAPAGAGISHGRVARERYIEGEVLYRGLERLMASAGWTPEAIAEWASPWVAMLEGRAVTPAARAPDLPLPAALFDCTPTNVVRRPDGTLATFDLEWQALDPTVTLAHVVFRGLYNALLRVEFVAPPAASVTTDIATLAAAAMIRLGLETAPGRIHEWIARDYALTGEIAGIARATAMPFLPKLRIAGAVPAIDAPASEMAARLRESEALLDQAVARQRELSGRARELDSILARPHHRLASWVGDLIEPFPRLRAAARAPFDALAGGARPRIGAIVHVYYDELWPELAGYLRNAAPLDRLYVSIREGAPAALEAAIVADFAQAQVRRVPNRGRDVAPFLEALEAARRDGVELVCKIHGKRSAHLPNGEAWRRDMLGKLLGPGTVVPEILECFRADSTLGIVGPGGHVMPSSFYWERNATRVTELAARMGLDVKGLEFRYVAGSMFWARVSALAPLLSLGLRAADFEAEDGVVDGSTAHALERCFPLAAGIGGYAVRESSNPTGSGVRDFAP